MLAARCLALLCHAATRDTLTARATAQLADLAPALSGEEYIIAIL